MGIINTQCTRTNDPNAPFHTTEYCGNHIYDNGELKQTLFDGGYLTYDGETPIYHFYVRDHLGNNRMVLDESGNIEQVTHYYPYGMSFAEGKGKNVQKYKFNGKELDAEDGLNWMDYGARMYDGALARWNGVDRFAEKYLADSPYSYCVGNPISNIDVNGDTTKLANEKTEEYVYEYLGLASDEMRKRYSILNESPNTYYISIDKTHQGGETFCNGESSYVLNVEDVGEYTVGILADELCGAWQIENGEVCFEKMGGDYYIRYYDLLDEVETKMDAISVLAAKGLKLQGNPTKFGENSAKFGILYDFYGGDIPSKELEKWGKNSSYYDYIIGSYGKNSATKRTPRKKYKK